MNAARQSTERDAMLGAAAQDYRTSRARVVRLVEAGESPPVCGDCGTETAVTVAAHSPRCGSYAPPVAGPAKPKAGGGPGQPVWETGRDGKRRSTRERGTANGKDTGFSIGHLKRQEEQMHDATPTVTSCGFDGCGWRFDGTALDGREASVAHRAEQHPDVGKVKRRRLPKPGQTNAQAGIDTGRAALAAMDAGEPQPEADIAADIVELPKLVEPVVEPETPDIGADILAARSRRVRHEPWPPEAILDAIRAHAATHGRPPTHNEWIKTGPDRPTATTVVAKFGKWSEAIVAAGFPRPTRGGQVANGNRRAALSEREPQGHEEQPSAPPASYAPGALSPEETVRSGSPGPAPTEPGSRSENAASDGAPPGFARALIKAARAFADTLEQEIG